MTGEFGQGSALENVPGHFLSQELLSWSVDHEVTVELPDFTFLGPYYAYSSPKDRVITTKLPLGSQGVLTISPSDTPDNSHTLSIAGFTDEAVGRIFMAGFPYQDTSEADREIAEIDSQENFEWSDRFSDRIEEDDSDKPQSSLSWPFRLYPQFGESNEDFSRRRDEENREWEDYNERQSRRDRQRQREDDRESERYQRMRDRINATYTPIVRHKVAFFGGIKDDTGENIASVNFNVQMESASIFIPYQPIEWEAFNDKLFLKLFLSYLDQDRSNLENWTSIFNGRMDKLGTMPRLAIMAKIQALGGEVE